MVELQKLPTNFMENTPPQTSEDLRDQRLLEKIESMLEKIESMLDRKLDAKFSTLDPLFGSIHDSFLAIDERFKVVDERFRAMDERFRAMDERFRAMDEKFTRKFTEMDEKISALQLSMIDVQEKVTVLTGDMANVKETLGHHTTTLDAISHRMDKWDKEFPIMSHNVLRIDRWVTEAAPIVGVKYVREDNSRDYLAQKSDLPS